MRLEIRSQEYAALNPRSGGRGLLGCPFAFSAHEPTVSAMRSFTLCGAWALAASLLGCSASPSHPTASDASTDVTSDVGPCNVGAGFTCDTLGPMSVCESAGPQYSCGSAGETCCKPGSYLSVDSGFCFALVEGGVGGVTPTPGTCAGQPCGAGCYCGLLQNGIATVPPSGAPSCDCAGTVTLACYQGFNCGSIACTLGCTCSDPSTGACVCPLDGGGGGVADAGSD
jgi:hypothetical protein